MNPLEDIAFENLQFIIDKENFVSNRFKVENNQFIKEDDEDDIIYSFKELEYPIYFTFHQIMNHVHSTVKPTFHNKTKKELIEMFELAIDTINEYYVEIDNNNKGFEKLIDDIEYKVSFIKDYYTYGFCLYLPTLVKDYYTYFCNILQEKSREIILDLKDPGPYDLSNTSSGEGVEDDSTDGYDSTDGDDSTDGYDSTDGDDSTEGDCTKED